MRTLGQIAGKMVPLWIALLCAAAFPNAAFADGNEKNESKAPTKLEAPAPLTERERWLLDRMEQLEKRVAELEAMRNTSPATEIGAPMPVNASSVAVPAPANARSVVAGAASSASAAAPGFDTSAK